MESEKVKEILGRLHCKLLGDRKNEINHEEINCVGEVITLINELESENERLIAEKQKVIEYMKTDNYAKLKKEDMYWGYQMGIGMLEHEIDRQKDRIAELEMGNAKLLDSVETVQSNRCVYKCVLTKEHLTKFAERLKEKLEESNFINNGLWLVDTQVLIDETLKEFIND